MHENLHNRAQVVEGEQEDVINKVYGIGKWTD